MLNGAAAMDRRRITRALGAAAGGLLGVAFFPTAVAFADDYDYVPHPGSTEVITGIYGSQTAPPALDGGTVQGSQLFDVDDTTTATTVGTFDADEATTSGIAGGTNQALLVTSSGTAGTDAPVGSVFDTYNFGDGYENIYSDLTPTGGSDVISDTLVTPFGDYTIPITFDAAGDAGDDVGAGAFLDDYGISSTSPETITAISGIPPLDMAYQGSQTFDNGAGTFGAAETTTTDIFGTHTEALLVTSDAPGTTAGTGTGDVPPVGSVFNVINFFDSYQLVYSDLPSPDGDVISDTLVTPFGDYTIPVTFDAAAIPDSDAAAVVALADTYDIVPVPDTETLTGINGVPPLDVAIQGTQQFGVGTETFYADVSTASDSLGDIDEAIRVISDGSGTAGDVPPVGSVFDIYALGDSGFENIYADLASTTPGGADVISDTVVTPLGDFTIPLASDAAVSAAVSAADSFLMLP
jgi:hypothetical protein